MAAMTGPEGAGGVPDQFRRDARLGGDGGLDLGDDGGHQVHDRGARQGPGVSALGGPLKQGVDDLGCEGVLQGGTDHDGNGTLLDEPLEDLIKDHGAAS
jgi:hypothetical protein